MDAGWQRGVAQRAALGDARRTGSALIWFNVFYDVLLWTNALVGALWIFHAWRAYAPAGRRPTRPSRPRTPESDQDGINVAGASDGPPMPCGSGRLANSRAAGSATCRSSAASSAATCSATAARCSGRTRASRLSSSARVRRVTCVAVAPYSRISVSARASRSSQRRLSTSTRTVPSPSRGLAEAAEVAIADQQQ